MTSDISCNEGFEIKWYIGWRNSDQELTKYVGNQASDCNLMNS